MVIMTHTAAASSTVRVVAKSGMSNEYYWCQFWGAEGSVDEMSLALLEYGREEMLR